MIKKWANIFKTFCSVNTARLAKYVWPFSSSCMKGLREHKDKICLLTNSNNKQNNSNEDILDHNLKKNNI